MRLDVLPPSDPRAAAALYAFMEDISASWFGRPVSDEEVRAGLEDFPSDDLRPPDGLLVVAHREGVACGCAGLRFVEPGLGEVTRVYVAPRQRRGGLGRRLMAEIERLAREHESGACGWIRAPTSSRPAPSTSRSATARSRASTTASTRATGSRSGSSIPGG